MNEFSTFIAYVVFGFVVIATSGVIFGVANHALHNESRNHKIALRLAQQEAKIERQRRYEKDDDYCVLPEPEKAVDRDYADGQFWSVIGYAVAFIVWIVLFAWLQEDTLSFQVGVTFIGVLVGVFALVIIPAVVRPIQLRLYRRSIAVQAVTVPAEEQLA